MQIDRKYTVAFDSKWPIVEMRKAIMDAHSIVLTAHTNADGDAVGSLTGMYALLCNTTSATVTPMLPDGVPDDLTWIPNTNKVLCGSTDVDRCRQTLEQADLIIGLDISGPGRTGNLEAPLRASAACKLLIDHHENPESDFFNALISEPEASSTCELVYWLFRQMPEPSAFNHAAATSLYTGICTDTGTLTYSNDHPSVYLAVADLLGYGIDPMYVNRQIKNSFTEKRMLFFGFAISQRLKVYEAAGVALMVLTASDMASHGVESHELTGLINEVMRLRTIDCGILVREEAGKVRLSLRSKERYDVNQMADTLFGGGGHRRAAGATSLLTLEETVAKIKQTLHLED